MSDLISRQALKENIGPIALLIAYRDDKGKIKRIKDVIDNQPTAYDVDKVVEKIREQDGVCTGCKRQYECNECSIGERIEIIKRGGKDETN